MMPNECLDLINLKEKIIKMRLIEVTLEDKLAKY